MLGLLRHGSPEDEGERWWWKNRATPLRESGPLYEFTSRNHAKNDTLSRPLTAQ
jgi:hypothetical protein